MKKRWQALGEALIGSKNYFLIDASVYSFFTVTRRLIDKYAAGRLLDAGAGRLAFKTLLSGKCGRYTSIDKYPARQELDVVGDLNRLPFKSAVFDTITCMQVLEHDMNPQGIFDDLAKALKNNGYLIISVPHISYLHAEPHDYFRFTKYALKNMAEKSGLRVVEIASAGSIFGFLFTPISDFLLAYTYGIPLIFPLIFLINSLAVRIISKIDGIFFRDSLMPVNYVMVAQKGN